jgi:outer membrane protein TolC
MCNRLLQRWARRRVLLVFFLLLAGFGLSRADGPPAASLEIAVEEPQATLSGVTLEPPPGAKVFELPIKPADPKLQSSKQLVEDLSKAAPVVPAGEQEENIDLATALRLAEVQNPAIAIGRQAIQEALAKQLQAQAMILPHARVGANYHLHNGVLQTSFGLIRHVQSRSFYIGAGSRTLAAETLAFPGIQFLNHLGDPYFERLAARQFVAVTRAQSVAISNIVLLEVAKRYLDLLGAEGDLAALKQSEAEMNLIVQLTANYMATKRGREADARRARTDALLLHSEEQEAEARVAVAAAELARVLHLDPSTRLHTPAKKIAMLPLVDASYTLEQLMDIALRTRPELAAIRAEIARKNIQYRQELWRPLLPTVSIGFSAGGFAGRTNRIDLVPGRRVFGLGARDDFDVIAYWTLLNAGLGNRALQNQRLSERNLAMIEQVRLLNQVRQEVASSQALVLARRQDVDIAELRLAAAIRGFQEDYTRIFGGGPGLPIELLNSMNRLTLARLNFIHTLASYNQAQFQLFVAIGQTPVASEPVAER